MPISQALTCEDELLNATETSLDDNNCLIHTFSLVIICKLLLAVVSITCYHYYPRYWKKQKHEHIKRNHY